jgi:di/tricarboxylate transporter
MGFEQIQDAISALVTSHDLWIGQGLLGILSLLVIVVIIVVLLLSNRTRAVAMVPIGDRG